ISIRKDYIFSISFHIYYFTMIYSRITFIFFYIPSKSLTTLKYMLGFKILHIFYYYIFIFLYNIIFLINSPFHELLETVLCYSLCESARTVPTDSLIMIP